LSVGFGVLYRGEIGALGEGRSADRAEFGLLMATGGRAAGSPAVGPSPT
jgi:hypothetical protein